MRGHTLSHNTSIPAVFKIHILLYMLFCVKIVHTKQTRSFGLEDGLKWVGLLVYYYLERNRHLTRHLTSAHHILQYVHCSGVEQKH